MRRSTAPLPLLAVLLCLALLPTVGWSQPARSSLGGILSLAWSPDGKHIATGSREGTLHLWGAASGKRTRVLATYPSPVVALAWSPNGRYVAASAGNGTLQILNVGSGRARRVLRGAQKVVSSLAWNRKGDRL